MIPPTTINVLDEHGGFTAEITPRPESRDALRNGSKYTIWQPGAYLAHVLGELQHYNEQSFYQMNDDVTVGTYKVPGYKWPVLCWFDNKTGERIA